MSRGQHDAVPALVPITQFTADTIVSGMFRVQIPDYYALHNIVESQAWHDNQSVFDHCLASARALEEITQFNSLQPSDKARILAYLAGKHERCSRLDLLRLATLLHDIGKLISLHRTASGGTSSPSHGVIGEWVAKPIVAMFDITPGEKRRVLDLISDHLVPSDLIEMAIVNGTTARGVVELLQSHRPDTVVELLLLAYADWQGCDIRESVRQRRDQRVAMVHECLRVAAPTLSLGGVN